MAKAPKDSLLRKAIIDAKQVREAAIANARMVLEEQFKPQISSMLSAKLRESELEEPTAADGHGKAEGGETDIAAIKEVENPDSSEIGTGDNKQPSADASDSSNVTNKGLETDTLGEALEEPTAADGHGKAEGGDSETAPIMEGDDEFDEFEGEGEDELDLESIIRELELDVDDESGEDEFGAEDSLDQAPEGDALDLDVDAAPEDDEDLGFDIEDDEVPAEDGDEFGGLDLDADAGAEAPEADAAPSDDEEELDLEGILREMEDEDEESEEEIHSENAALKHSVKEHRQVIQYLRTKLHEVNMLNAKLLYTNKLFRSFNLAEGQKRKIVETFDRANTIREVKLVFSTLAESYRGGSVPKKKIAGKSITEGIASRATGGSTAPKSPKVLTEGADAGADDPVVSRLKKLANIL